MTVLFWIFISLSILLHIITMDFTSGMCLNIMLRLPEESPLMYELSRTFLEASIICAFLVCTGVCS